MSIGFKIPFIQFIRHLQNEWCEAIEKMDGSSVFVEDLWERPEGGGGRSRVLSHGKVFEKAGINISEIEGNISEAMAQLLGVEETTFFACGISLVIHPKNPFAPTVHANYRYFEIYRSDGSIADFWFGGGSDLTPFYLFEEDAVHFHHTLNRACSTFGPSYYSKFKQACDHYFFNHHRGEARGIGGIFFDFLRSNSMSQEQLCFEFTTTLGKTFLNSYLPIIEKRKNSPYSKENKYWQELRRGRYVEFNLLHDRGTLFGLKSNGRIESIFMSLPPTVRWDYCPTISPQSLENNLIEVLKKPKNWIDL